MEELIDSVCDYVKKPYTDYAIMINGEWGSGKTYFWNNKLRSRLEAIKIGDKTYKTIYMSLYGINSLEEISKKIFIETNPMISKTLKKFVDTREGNIIPEFVKTGLDMANLFGNVNLGNDKVDFSKVFAIDDKILCFDDLERANVDVIDILGYINNFVEHDGIKTILICNEKELATKFKNTNIELKTLIASYILDKEGNLVLKTNKKKINKELIQSEEREKPLGSILEEKVSDIFDKANAYERIKEKLIGETFEYIPEYAYILNGMIMKYSYNEDLSYFFKKNTFLIISAFKKSDTRNLRILKHALNDFEKIFNTTMKEYPKVQQYILCTMLTFTIAMSFEIKAGNICKDQLKEMKDNNEYNSVIFTSKILNDKNQFYLREFDSKYFLNDLSNYKFFKFIEVYIRTRFFDEKIFKENMDDATKTSVAGKKTINNDYNKIINGQYWRLNDEEFEDLYIKTLDDVKAGKVFFNDYFKLFIVYKYLVSTKLISIPVKKLKSDFELGMQIAATENIKDIKDLEESLTLEELSTQDGDIQEIADYFESVRKSALNNLIKVKAKALFEYLPDNVLEFYKQMIGEYKDIVIFANYNMEDLYVRLRGVPNYDLHNIINMLQDRYRDNKKLLKQELPSLKELSISITKDRDESKKTISQALLENLAQEINKFK
ncbi:MAG: P-loop NTPase fold protein [Clostridia bacterium]